MNEKLKVNLATFQRTDKGWFVGTSPDRSNWPILVRRGDRNNTVVTVGTETNDFFGANEAYFNTLVHPRSPVVMLSPTSSMSEIYTDAAALLEPFRARIIFLTGGDDLGEHYTGVKADTPLATFYGTNPNRDKIESQLLKTYIAEGDKHFFMGICRGMQILTAELTNNQVLPRDVEEHRPKPDPTSGKMPTIPDTHPVRNVLPAEIMEGIGFPDITRVSSHHHQGIYLDELKPHLPRLAEMGWYVALVASEGDTEIVEALIRAKKDTDGNWITLGAAVQGHPERPSGQHDKTNSEWQQAELNSKNFASWLLAKQEAFIES